jgi:hypothetical protein
MIVQRTGPDAQPNPAAPGFGIRVVLLEDDILKRSMFINDGGTHGTPPCVRVIEMNSIRRLRL